MFLNGRKTYKEEMKMNIKEIGEFLETDTISFKFSSVGLKYLSLDKKADKLINLANFDIEREKDFYKILIIKETINFFNRGYHNIKLDLEAFTDFQKNVLIEVSKIKPGEIYTYKEIAISIGNPDAARAVGNTLSKNPFAYFIPAHRVLPKRGIGSCKSGAGYLRTKLLQLEGHDISKLKMR